MYKLLKHPYQLDESAVEDVAPTYLEFVEGLFDYLNKISDNKIRIRQLNVSCIDFETFKTLEEPCLTENSKLELVFLDRLLSLINMKQELIYRQVEYPKFFINIGSEWKSPLYLNNEVIKLISMMELTCGASYISNGIIRIDHKEISLGDVAHISEKVFDVNSGDTYKKESMIIRRESTKITEFLDRLEAAIIRKSKEEGYYRS